MNNQKIKSMAGLVVLSVFVLCCANIQSAQATTLIYKNFTDLAKESPHIVRAEVLEVHIVNSLPKGKTDYTYVVFAPVESIKGPLPKKNFVLRFRGMMRGPYVIPISGMPVFEEGQDYILFVKNMRASFCPVTGWEQGNFKIGKDEKGREVVLDSAGRKIVDIQDGELIREDAGSKKDGLAAETTALSPMDFFDRINEVLSQETASPLIEGQSTEFLYTEDDFPPLEEE